MPTLSTRAEEAAVDLDRLVGALGTAGLGRQDFTDLLLNALPSDDEADADNVDLTEVTRPHQCKNPFISSHRAIECSRRLDDGERRAEAHQTRDGPTLSEIGRDVAENGPLETRARRRRPRERPRPLEFGRVWGFLRGGSRV